MPKAKNVPVPQEELETKPKTKLTPKVREILRKDKLAERGKKERLNAGVKGWNRYPWRKWFSQSSFVLKRHKHFKHEKWVMAQQIRNNAVKFKVKVSISMPEGTESVVVRVKNPMSPLE